MTRAISGVNKHLDKPLASIQTPAMMTATALALDTALRARTDPIARWGLRHLIDAASSELEAICAPDAAARLVQACLVAANRPGHLSADNRPPGGHLSDPETS